MPDPLVAQTNTVVARPVTPLESLLDEHKRNSLIHYLGSRIQSIEASLSGFRDKRRRFEQQMNDNFEWRRGGRARGSYTQASVDDWAQSIFDLQNDTLNIVGGFAAFMVARTYDDIFGTAPYYTINPEGLADQVLAQTLQKHSEWKLGKSEWKEAGGDAIDNAFGIGEAVIKSSWCREVDVFETRKTVLVDTRSRQPVLTVDGDYVYEDDIEQGQGVDEAGQAIAALLVKKDPRLVLDVRFSTFVEMEIEQQNISYDNVKSHVMHYGDVLIPENEPNVHESNFFGHKTQMRLSELIAKYQIADLDLISLLRTDTTEAKTESRRPAEHLDENEEREPQQDVPDPNIALVECWVKHDPVGDGRMRRMYILYATTHQKIITMDYIANVTPEGALPVEVVRAYKVKNRWYGRGYFEIYEKAQEFIDRHLNYVAYRNRYHSQPVTFSDPSLLLEDEESEEFEIRPGVNYRLKPGTKVEDFMQILEFPDLDERTWQLMQMMIQVVQVRSGVTSAAQGEVSSMPSTATATGIESILQSASTLARLPIGNIRSGLERSLLYAIKLIYANMNTDEVFTYLEGDQQKVGTLQALSIKTLDMNVRLLLTRFKQRENLEASEKAIALVTGQYLPLPEPEKQAVRPMFIQAIKALGFDQADTIVRQPIIVDPMTGLPVGQSPDPGSALSTTVDNQQPMALPAA